MAHDIFRSCGAGSRTRGAAMKRSVSLLLALVMIFGLAVPAFGAPQIDPSEQEGPGIEYETEPHVTEPPVPTDEPAPEESEPTEEPAPMPDATEEPVLEPDTTEAPSASPDPTESPAPSEDELL